MLKWLEEFEGAIKEGPMNYLKRVSPHFNIKDEFMYLPYLFHTVCLANILRLNPEFNEMLMHATSIDPTLPNEMVFGITTFNKRMIDMISSGWLNPVTFKHSWNPTSMFFKWLLEFKTQRYLFEIPMSQYFHEGGFKDLKYIKLAQNARRVFLE